MSLDVNVPLQNQTPDQNKPTGHYSQLAWASTYKVGCAVAWCDQVGGMEREIVRDRERARGREKKIG